MGNNVHQRLAAAMQVVKYIQNEKKPGMQYRTVSHDKVTAKVRPALLDAGIVYYPVRCDYVQSGNRTECSVTVRFVNIDEPTDYFDVPTLGFGVDGQDKGPGKAMSYAVKYALLKAMGLETGEDPDDDADTPAYQPPNLSLKPEKKRLEVINRIRGLVNVDDLRECYRDLPQHLKDDADIMAEFHGRKAELEASAAHGVA